MEHAKIGSEESYVNYELMIPEIENLIKFYIDKAIWAREERDVKKFEEPEGHTELTEEYADEYFPKLDLEKYLGADVTLPAIVPNTTAAILIEAGIADNLEEANSEAEETRVSIEVDLADNLANADDWSDQDTWYYADCSLDAWKKTSLENRWRKLAYHARGHDYIRGVPNYFRYHAVREVGSEVEAEPYEVKSVINIAKFLGKEDDEPGTKIENGLGVAKQLVVGGLLALKKAAEQAAERAIEIKSATHSILKNEE